MELRDAIAKRDVPRIRALCRAEPHLADDLTDDSYAWPRSKLLALAPVLFEFRVEDDSIMTDLLLAALHEGDTRTLARARNLLLRMAGNTDVGLHVAAHLRAAKSKRDALAIWEVALARNHPHPRALERALEVFAHARPGERPPAKVTARWFELAEAAAGRQPGNLVALARISAQSGDDERAVRLLERAANLGALPERAKLAKDAGFASLRKLPRFRELGSAAKPVPFGKGATRGIRLVERAIAVLTHGPRAKRARGAKAAKLKGAVLGVARLPDTLRRFLEFDLTFDTLCCAGTGFAAVATFGRNPAAPNFAPSTARGVIDTALAETCRVGRTRLVLDTRGRAALDRIAARLQGRFFRLPHLSDQHHYLYVGKPDKDGEFPIVGVEPELAAFDRKTGRVDLAELAIWVKYPSFDLYLADQIGLIADPTAHREFKALCRHHERNNPELRAR